MRRRAVLLSAIASAAVLAAGTAVATSPTITAPASVFALAERGESVQVIAPPPPPAPTTARYRVALNINWTSATHPGTLPFNAHLSPPVLAVHQRPGSLFAVDAVATPGIEAMAERGVTSTLVSELQRTGGVVDVRVGSGVPAPAVATRTFDIEVSQSGHLISMVTMLAPSPDWFVGIADQPTFVDGQWAESISIPLGNYDSGTDSGTGFSSPNSDTQPQLPISGPRDASFVNAVVEGSFGTITITRTG